jgi:hypothetical protein
LVINQRLNDYFDSISHDAPGSETSYGAAAAGIRDRSIQVA